MTPGLRLGTLKHQIISARKKHKKRSHLEAEAKEIRHSLLMKDYSNRRRRADRQMEMELAA